MMLLLCTRHRCILALLGIVLLVGCSATEPEDAQITHATPTLSAGFERAPTTTPDMHLLHPTITMHIVPTTMPRPQQRLEEIPVYDGMLDANWTTKFSWGVRLALGDKNFTRDGTGVIAVTPTDDYGALFLAVRPEATAIYTRGHIIGVSFWLSGGDHPIPNDALTMAVLGSNQYEYWRKDDTSVRLEGRVTNDASLFSETRLYYLDIRHTIPPKTWVEVVNWLDERYFDPSYTYVTGIYIKNDAGFEQTFYIDHVKLLVQK